MSISPATMTRTVAGAGADRTALLHRFHEATGVHARHLALPLAAYAGLSSFTATNDAFLEVGVGLGEQAVRAALVAAGLWPGDIDHIMSVSVTGIGVPSLDARLVPRLGLRTDVRRIPVFGLGCVAGVAGISRLHDVLRGDPDGVVVLLSVELCSLTVQHNDASTANLIASGLFGDGAAAVVLAGDRRAAAMGPTGPRVLDTRSRFYPDTEGVMGWDIGESGFRIVLAPTVADVVEKYLREDVDGFLSGHRLGVADVATWVTHPGGRKSSRRSRGHWTSPRRRWRSPGSVWPRSVTCPPRRCCTCWTARCGRGLPLVTRGPYRWLRHPNYLAVIVEGAALPLVHSAWLTALVFTVANLALLRVRIGVEQAALAAAAPRPATTVVC